MVNKEIVVREKTTDDSVEIIELKHSIRIHLLIMAGPSQQLCAFLVKLIDLVEDIDIPRRKTEALQLAFSITEAIALHVQQAIDARDRLSKQTDQNMPESVRRHADEIMIAVGKARGHTNKIEAKNSILVAVGKALDALESFTKGVYPTIFDSAGNRLNNHQKRPANIAAGPIA
jgi:hypothetical protein